MGIFRKMMGKDADATKPARRGLSAPLQRSADEGVIGQLQRKVRTSRSIHCRLHRGGFCQPQA